MNINDFISRYNSHVPSVEQIIEKFLKTQSEINYAVAEEDRNRMLIEITGRKDKLNDSVEDLIFKTNISKISIGAINFATNVWIIEDRLKEFAIYNDYYKICLNQVDNSIVLFDEGQDSFDTISVSFNQFLHFLYIYSMYDRSIIFGDGILESTANLELEILIENGLDNWFVSTLMPLR